MSFYFTKFKTLWDEYANYQPFTVCTCGSKSAHLDVQHKEHVFRFLMGLNDSYGNIIGQILLLEPFPSLSKVCFLILQEEKRRYIGQDFNMIQSGDAVAMYVNSNKGFPSHQGHKNGGKKGNGKKDRHVCTYCGLTGHIVDKCYKLHGYPPSYKPKGGNKAMANQVASMQPSGNFGMDVFPSNVNFGFMPTKVLPNVDVQYSGALQNACVQSNIASQNHVGPSFGGSCVQAGP